MINQESLHVIYYILMIRKLFKVCFFSNIKTTKTPEISLPSTAQISYPRQQSKKQEI